jgi:hypothetical protein
MSISNIQMPIAARELLRQSIVSTIMIASLSPLWSQSQWSGSSPGPIYYNGGNVGIGTTNPIGKTQVQLEDGYTALMTSNPTGVPRFALNNNAGGSWTMYDYAAGWWSPGITQRIGNVGIGTTTPPDKLTVTGGRFQLSTDTGGGSLIISKYDVLTRITSAGPSGGGVVAIGREPVVVHGQPAGNYSVELWSGANGSLPTLTAIAGNVGIGTTAPQHKLSVNGTIGAKEVIVTNTGWADHVFKPDYSLEPLSAVEAHIQQHGRLPGIPSEEQVQTAGVNLGDIQVRLLAKIEELTLHMIAMDKRYRGLEEHNQTLQKALSEMETRLAR